MKVNSAALLAFIGAALQHDVNAFSTVANSRRFTNTRQIIRRHHASNRLPHFAFALNMATPALPTINIETAPPEQIDALVRSEYELWLQKFGKARSESRFPTFKKNYLLQLQYDQQIGVYSGLNEFGDLTPEEYEAMTARPAEAPVPADAITPGDVDVKIRSEYQAWGKEHTKSLSEERYAIFKQNFLANMKYYEQTGKYHVLNEYADMTPDEFDGGTPKKPVDGGIQEASSSAPAAASSTNYMDSLGGGNTLGKGPPFMPTKYRDTAGTGMPSYFDTMGASSTSAQSEGSPPSTGAGAGLPSYADALSGGSGTTKPASYMPKKYKDTSGSGMPSYFNSMGSAPAPVDYNTPTVVSPVVPTPAAAAAPSGAGLPSYTNALSGGNTEKMKESSFMPKSYKESSGSGMPSYFDSMGSASNSNYSSPPAPVSTNSPASGTGMPSYTNALSGGSSDKMKQSSFMPKSYKQSSGSGMPSYFDSMGTAPTSYSSPPAPATTETSYASPAVSTNPTSDAGVSSYTSALSGGGPGKMKESSYMPKSFKQSPGSGMPSYFDSLGGGGNVANSPSSGTGSYLDSMNVASTPSGAGLPSYTDGLSGSGGAATAKQSSYMPKSYKQPTGAGMPSYLDNMGSAWSSPKVETKAPPPNIRPNIAPQTQAPPVNIRPNIAPQTQASPANIRPNIAPLPGMKADQAAQLARIASPARGPSFNHPLANPITKSSTLPCDQTIIMREGESFLPHAQDPVIKRGTLEPDQSSAMRYFFTGRLCATEPFRAIPMKTRFPSDQERAENQTRQSLMYFQKATRNVRRNPPEN